VHKTLLFILSAICNFFIALLLFHALAPAVYGGCTRLHPAQKDGWYVPFSAKLCACLVLDMLYHTLRVIFQRSG
jgi:hypothetical protein